MKSLIPFLVLFGLFLNTPVCAQSPVRVVFFEHSIRWMDESNFPHYLKIPQVEEAVLEGVGHSLGEKFGVTEGGMPEQIDYRKIDSFGKSKVKWPKSPSGTEIAIVSSMTRKTTGFGILWSMQIQVRNGSKISFSNSVEHELEPFTASCYLTKQRWLSEQEFTTLFLELTEETLGMIGPLPPVVTVGSFATLEAKVNELLPVQDKYTLAIAGGMLSETNSSYFLKKDSAVVQHFFYREGSDLMKQNFFSQVLSDIFSSVIGLNVEYDLKVKYQKRGSLETGSSGKTRLSLTWLARKGESALIDIPERIVSPILGEMYDRENVYASFAYYKRLNTNYEELTKKNFRLTGSRGTLGVSDTHFITGKLNGVDFEVAYPEQEGIVLIHLANQAVAALTMFNENPESGRFGGRVISKNRKVMTSTTSAFSKPDAGSDQAEVYSLYTSGLSPETVEDSVRLLILLFFSVAQTIESNQ